MCSPDFICGIGIDIETVSRFRALPPGDAFYRRNFSAKERTYCGAQADPFTHLAARFAAKEAYFKASGTAVHWQDIELISTRGKRPLLLVCGRPIDGFVSISHTDETAVAVVILCNQHHGPSH